MDKLNKEKNPMSENKKQSLTPEEKESAIRELQASVEKLARAYLAEDYDECENFVENIGEIGEAWADKYSPPGTTEPTEPRENPFLRAFESAKRMMEADEQ
jgi:hypothetical protein